MRKDIISTIDFDKETKVDVSFKTVITTCPLCRVAVHPKTIYSLRKRYSCYNADHFVVYELCHCGSCDGIFMSVYKSDNGLNLEFVKAVPQNFCSDKFSSTISNISSDFPKIYNQALQAEQNNLYEICGMGYRKALEFLIKDYLKIENPADKNKISNMQLGKCIDAYISDVNLKATASRSAWLGNDETHYLRKHTDKDLQDLKRFIDATVYWIQYIETTKDALAIQPK